jgi:hypothetical protein
MAEPVGTERSDVRNISAVVTTGVARVLGTVVAAGALVAGCSAAAGSSDRDLAGAGGALLGDVGEQGGITSTIEGVGGARVATDRVALRGDDEVPGPGVAAASGTAEVVVIEERNEVCVEIVVVGLDQPSAAHLHRGGSGEAGDVVLALPAPSEGTGSVDACVTAAPKVIERLIDDLSGFYVNVHSVAAPDGALRGQLG